MVDYIRKFYLNVCHLATQQLDGTWLTACSRHLKSMDDPTGPTAHEGYMCATCELYFRKHGLEIRGTE